jgi:hypothetical protein
VSASAATGNSRTFVVPFSRCELKRSRQFSEFGSSAMTWPDAPTSLEASSEQ